MLFLNISDTISIAVGAYPEGHPDATSKQDDMNHLTQKVRLFFALVQYYFWQLFLFIPGYGFVFVKILI